MSHLMQRRAMPIHRLEIGLRRWHPHEVADRVVIGARTADAQVGAAGADQCLHRGQDEALGYRRRRGRRLLRQALALVRVEDGEPLEERDRPRVVATLAGTFTLL